MLPARLTLWMCLLMAVASCKPRTLTLQGVSVDAPRRWSVCDLDPTCLATKGGQLDIEVTKDPLPDAQAFAKALASVAGVRIVESHAFPSGFGYTYEEKGRKRFAARIRIGDTTYKCLDSRFYSDPKFIPEMVSMVATMRAAGAEPPQAVSSSAASAPHGTVALAAPAAPDFRTTAVALYNEFRPSIIAGSSSIKNKYRDKTVLLSGVIEHNADLLGTREITFKAGASGQVFLHFRRTDQAKAIGLRPGEATTVQCKSSGWEIGPTLDDCVFAAPSSQSSPAATIASSGTPHSTAICDRAVVCCRALSQSSSCASLSRAPDAACETSMRSFQKAAHHLNREARLACR